MKAFNMENHPRLRGTFGILAWAIPTIMVTGLLVFYMEKLSDKLFTAEWGFFGPLIGVVVLVFAILGLIFWQHDKITRQMSASANILDSSDIAGEKRPYLICGYSPISLTLDFSTFTKDIGEACNQNDSPLKSWQQNLRVLKEFPNVTHLYVIDNNQSQFEDFKKTLHHFCDEKKLMIIRVTGKNGETTLRKTSKNSVKPDYEDFEYVTMAIDRAIEMITQEHKINAVEVEKKTMIDITAGQKPFSIAGAISSLNRGLYFVYATTLGQEKKVFVYDASIRLFQGHEL